MSFKPESCQLRISEDCSVKWVPDSRCGNINLHLCLGLRVLCIPDIHDLCLVALSASSATDHLLPSSCVLCCHLHLFPAVPNAVHIPCSISLFQVFLSHPLSLQPCIVYCSVCNVVHCSVKLKVKVPILVIQCRGLQLITDSRQSASRWQHAHHKPGVGLPLPPTRPTATHMHSHKPGGGLPPPPPGPQWHTCIVINPVVGCHYLPPGPQQHTCIVINPVVGCHHSHQAHSDTHA